MPYDVYPFLRLLTFKLEGSDIFELNTLFRSLNSWLSLNLIYSVPVQNKINLTNTMNKIQFFTQVNVILRCFFVLDKSEMAPF